MIDYQQVLADLESRRKVLVSDLDAAIRAVRQILQAGSQRLPVLAAAQGPVNQTKAIFDYLVGEAPRSVSPKAVAQGTGLDEKAVRGILNRLYRGKKIDRPTRGKYKGKAQAHDTTAMAA